MNNERENGMNPSLNGKPYYSADNGYAAAASVRGIAEAVPGHIDVIIRNEELQIVSDHKKFQEKIKSLECKKKGLEENKDDCQKKIREKEVKIAEQEAALAELTAKFNAPPEAEVMPSPDSVIKDLRDNKKRCEQNLRSKGIEKTTLEAESEIPLTVEALKNLVELTGIDMPKVGFSTKQCVVAVFYTLSFIGLLGYVYIFYASVAMKAFSPESDQQVNVSSQQTDADGQIEVSGQQTDPALNQFVDPYAWQKAWDNKPRRNYFVLLFPMIFIIFAIALHFCINRFLESNLGKWLNIGAILFLVLTFFFDLIIAENISQNIEDIKQSRIAEQEALKEAVRLRLEGTAGTESTTNQDPVSENFFVAIWGWIFNLSPIIFLGFIPSLLLTCGIYTTLESWKRVRPYGEYIKKKEHEYKVQLAYIDASIEELRNEISSLDTQIASRIQADRHPIQIEMHRIETEKENIEKDLATLNEIVGNIQEEVVKYQTQIEQFEEFLRIPEINPVDTIRMEKHVKEFMKGWCRFIAWQQTELTSQVSEEIKKVQQVADQTLDGYKKAVMPLRDKPTV